MVYYADLYLTYIKLLVRVMAQYRLDFLIMIIASILHDGATLLFLTVVFANIQQLQGWSFHEMLLIFGLSVTGRSLWNTFLDIPHRIQSYIRRGQLDILLVRPPSVLFQMAGENGINPPGLGRVAVGLSAILLALGNPTVDTQWWWVFYLTIAILSGVFIQFSINMMLACLSFWFTNVHSLLITIGWMNLFGQYPLHIFAWPLQFVLTWVLPFALMGFYPAAFLLRGEPYRVMGILAPFMGFLLFGLTLAIWRTSIRHSQSTGS